MSPESDGIRARVLNGVFWKAASAIIRQLSRVVTALILARLLSPHDYGIAGMVLVVSSLVLVFADLAFGAALIQRRELSDEDRSTAFWTNVAGGALFTAGGIALAGPVASFFGEPAVKPLFMAFSATFLVTALASTQSALLSRDMNFRSLELRQILAYGAGAIVGIATAAAGMGPWALILQQITIAVASTVLLALFSPWRPQFVFSFASLRSMAGFSSRIFLTRLFFYTNRNIDNVLVGRFIGSAALGAYALAYNVMLAPFSNISGPIQEVLFPAFSRVQDDPGRIASGWMRVNRMVGAITVPSLLGLIVVAPDFVHVVLGDRWRAATPVIQILSWVGLLQSLQGLNSGILEARNHTRSLLRYSIIVLVASVLAFVGGLHWGIIGVATGYAISSTIVEPYYTLITARSIDLPLRTFLVSLRGVAEAAVLMGAAVLGVRLLLLGTSAPAFVRLGACIVTGLLVYVPALLWRAPQVRGELQSLRPRRPALKPVGVAQPSEP